MLRTLVNRPIAVTMVLLSIVVLGLVSIHLLPVSLIPDVDIPYITVQVADAKLSARQMEESVIKPIKQQLMQLDEVEDITCISKDGNGTIKLSFNYGSNIDFLFIEVNERVDRIMPYLPENMQRPRVIKASATDIPAFYINITLSNLAQGDFAELSRFTTKVINRRIEQLPQVAMSDISGFDSPEILIIPDREKMQSLGISLEEFENYIKRTNIHLGTLSIRDGEYRYDVKFESLLFNLQSLKDILINKKGRLLRLGDIAQFKEQAAERSGYIYSNGKQALSLAVIKQKDAKMSDLKKSIDNLMKEFELDYPDINFEITRNQTQLLDYSINSLLVNILLAIILSAIVIFLFFREIRTSLLIILVIPTSLIFSMLLFYLFGLSLNTLSLSGLLLGVGMMVDNTIILIDNISGRWARSSDLYSSVIEGTKEVRGAMFSSLLTTCCVFIPIVFISGIAGALFSHQAIAVTITLLTSYFITITVVPVYYYWWFRKQKETKSSHSLVKFDFITPMLKWESRVMNKCIERSRIFIILIAVASLGSFFIFSLLKKEKLPHITYNECIANIVWNKQISVEQNRERVKEIENIIENKREHITSLIGVQQYVLGHSPDLSISEASLYIKCNKEKELLNVKEIIIDFLKTHYPNAICTFKEAGNVLDVVFGENQSLLSAKLMSANASLQEIPKLYEQINEIGEEAPITSKVRLKKDVLYIANPTAMALYGITYGDILYTLKNTLNGNTILEIIQGEQILPVTLGDEDKEFSKMITETFINKGGVRIPLQSLLRETYREDFQEITSGADGEYVALDLDVQQNDIGSVMRNIEKKVAANGDFALSFSGSWFTNIKNTKEMALALIVALIMLYIILAAQFESLLQPLIILSEIVLDIFVILLVMILIGESINIMSLIGLVVVSGIVINDSILKIDTINKIRRSEGMTLRQSLMEAGDRRMKAIIMTSLTTIISVLPFMKRGSMGDDLQFPMSLVIIVGMTVGTLISLFVVPALYHLLYNKRKQKDE